MVRSVILVDWNEFLHRAITIRAPSQIAVLVLVIKHLVDAHYRLGPHSTVQIGDLLNVVDSHTQRCFDTNDGL